MFIKLKIEHHETVVGSIYKKIILKWGGARAPRGGAPQFFSIFSLFICIFNGLKEVASQGRESLFMVYKEKLKPLSLCIQALKIIF
jgi:hypothetical protein